MPLRRIPFPESPCFERRGLMLDISRNRVPTMRFLKWLIDRIAELRYNELQLYTEHTFAYSKHETVWREASPMTASEIQEIDLYCTERGIELVPNQNSFGHMERWLRHDAYRPLAECPDGFEHPIAGWREFGSTLYPDAQSEAFIDSLYTELLPNFKSTRLHIGGDEPWELGKGRSASEVAAKGKHHVYLNFMKQLCSLTNKHGRTPQFWADIILERPDLVPELPKEVTPVIWGYEADSPFHKNCKIVSEAGFENNFYVAPGAGNWNSFGGRLDVARANIALAAKEAHLHNANGFLLTAWGDNGHHQPWPTLYPSLILGALAAWGIPENEIDFEATIDSTFFPNEAPGNGSTLCQLGKIDTLLPQPAPPSSFLHTAFFAEGGALKKLVEPIEADQLNEVAEALNALSTEGLDSEIIHSISLNKFAIERCQNAKTGNALQATTGALDELKAVFAEQWKQHSRPGGLAESLALMDRSTR